MKYRPKAKVARTERIGSTWRREPMTSRSLQAHVAFWSLLGLEALVVGFLGGWQKWLALLLLTLPLFAYFLARQKRNLQSLVIVFLDELAKEWRLLKFPEATPETPRVETRPIKIRGAFDKASPPAPAKP